MGIVIRQASKSSISSYAGAFIGFFNVAILMTQLFSTDQFGLRTILLDIAVVYSLFAQIGTGRSIVKFHPFFYDKKRSDNGLFTYSLFICLIGYLSIAAIVVLLKKPIVDYYEGKSDLFVEFFWVIFPLSLLMLLNLMFESNLQAKVRTAFSAFLKDVLHRLVITGLLGLFYFKLINFQNFILLFVLSYAFNLIFYIGYLKKQNQLSFKMNQSLFTRKVKRIYFRYSLFSFWTNTSGVLVNKLDTLMIFYFLGLSSVAVYGNALYLTLMISIPSAAIAKISFPIITKHWKDKRIDLIDDLYKKTALNQLIIGGVLFILLWANIDNLFAIQGPKFSEGKYIILILGVGRIVNIMCGVNTQIINASKYYPFASITSSLLVFFIIASNMVFIPMYGLYGAAYATGASLVLYNLSRLIFIYKKMDIQPFSNATIKCLIILMLGFAIGVFLPQLENIYLDTLYRSVITFISLGLPLFFFQISPEINATVLSFIKKMTNT